MSVMNGSYEVSPGRLSADGEEIRRQAGAFGADLDDLDAAVGRLIQATSGQTQRAYQEVQAAWTSSAEGLRATLTDIGAKTVSIAETFFEADRRGSRVFMP